MTQNENIGGVYVKKLRTDGTVFTLSNGASMYSDLKKGDRVVWDAGHRAGCTGTVEYVQLLRIDGRGDVPHALVTFDEIGVFDKWLPEFELESL